MAKGTVRDGTWTATYPLSIADHPGTGYIEAQAVAADGVTRSVSNTFRSCYPSKFTDLVVTPATIDADHPDVTIRGMLGYTTSADSPPQPAAGIRVFLASAEVTTDAQGGFAISAHLDGEPLLQTWGPGSIFVQGVVCATSATPAVTVNKQQTQVTGRVVTVQPVAPGAAVTLQGTLVRLSPTAGRVPAPGAEMEAWMYSEATAENVYLGTVFTGADGAFSIVATAPPYPTSGPVTLQHVPNADGFLLPSQAVVGRIDTHPRATAT